MGVENEVFEKAESLGFLSQVATTRKSEGRQRKINTRRLMELCFEKEEHPGDWTQAALMEYEPQWKELIRGGTLYVGRRKGGVPHISWTSLFKVISRNKLEETADLMVWLVSTESLFISEVEEMGTLDQVTSLFDYLNAGERGQLRCHGLT